MNRLQARITVYEEVIPDEQPVVKRLIDFATSPEEREQIKEDVNFHLSQVHILTDEGRVFVLRLSNIEEI